MKIFKQNEAAALPEFATEGSACFDLRACLENEASVTAYNPHNRSMQVPVKTMVTTDSPTGRYAVSIQSNFRVLIPTGLIFDIPKNHVMNIYARSSMSLKRGLMIANGVSVIDSDYVDPTYVMIYNASDTPFAVYHGERIAQAELRELKKYALVERKTPPTQKTEREGGIGSTGTE